MTKFFRHWPRQVAVINLRKFTLSEHKGVVRYHQSTLPSSTHQSSIHSSLIHQIFHYPPLCHQTIYLPIIYHPSFHPSLIIHPFIHPSIPHSFISSQAHQIFHYPPFCHQTINLPIIIIHLSIHNYQLYIHPTIIILPLFTQSPISLSIHHPFIHPSTNPLNNLPSFHWSITPSLICDHQFINTPNYQ